MFQLKVAVKRALVAGKVSFASGALVFKSLFVITLLTGFLFMHNVGAIAKIPAIKLPDKNDPSINASYDPSTILVKIKPQYRNQINDGNPDNPGPQSLDNTLGSADVTGFDQVAEKSPKAKQSTELFGWYKVEINNGNPPESVQQGKTKVYPELEQLEDKLKKDKTVASVSKDYEAKVSDTIPNDPYYSSTNSWGQGYDDLWGLKDINAAKAWDITQGSTSTNIAVIDTGIDRNHPELSGNIWNNPNDPVDGIDNDNNGYVDDTYGWNWCNNNNNTLDDNGHGTHVAGTIGAVGNNSTGVVGVNWRVKMVPLKFLCSNGSGSLSGGAAALQYAADMGIKVSSNSWSCSGCRSQITEDAIAYEVSKGTTPVVAAGNDGWWADDNEPASVDGSITVGAVDSTNSLAWFSNYGYRNDIMAPGVGILSLKASGATSTCNSAPSVVNTNYCQINGTSMATPHVSGTVGLMLSVNPNLTTEQIRQILHITATDLGNVGVDKDYSFGLLNAQKAVQASASPTVLTPKISSPASFSTLTGTVNITGSADGTGFANYKVEAGESSRNPWQWTTLAYSTSPVTNGTLAVFDTTALRDDDYMIRLTVTDTNGKTYVYNLHKVVINNVDANIDLPRDVASKGLVKIKGRANMFGGLNFDHYTIDWGQAPDFNTTASSFSSSGVTLANGGNVAAPNRMTELGTIDTTNWQDGGAYWLRLIVYASNGRSESVGMMLQFDKNLVPGWPQYTSDADCQSWCWGNNTAMADVDGDGQKEVIIPRNSNKIDIRKKDGSELSGWPVTVNAGEHFDNYGTPIAVDVDGDLLPEIIAYSTIGNGYDKNIYVIKSNGQIMPGWPKRVSTDLISEDPTPSIGDLNKDGINELVFFTDDVTNGQNLHAFEPDGTELSGFPKNLPLKPRSLMPVSLFDIDKDGYLEIMLSIFGKIYVFDHNGNVKSGWPVTVGAFKGYNQEVLTTPTVADLRGDGNYEVVAYSIYPNTNWATAVWAYSASGSLLPGWPYDSGNLVTGLGSGGNSSQGITVADIDADGKDELILPGSSSNQTGSGTAIIKDGQGVVSTPYNENWYSLSLADLKGDGKAQMFGGCNYCNGESMYPHYFIRYANQNATTYWKSNLENGMMGAGATQMVSADLDKNNKQDYSITYRQDPYNEYLTGNYTYLWESQDTSNPKDNWPMYAHDAQHTSRFKVGQKSSDTTPPQVVVASPAKNSSVSGSVSVSANAIDDESINKVDFYVDGTFVGTDNSWPYSTSWNTSGLNAGVQHAVTAKAFDSSNNSTTSSAVSVSVADTTSPNAPTNLRKTGSSSTTIIAAWDTPSDDIGVTGYKIYKNGTFVANTSNNSYTVTGLAPSTQYSIGVEAFDAANNISTRTSSNMTSAPDTTAPNAPTGLSASNISDNSMKLNWTAPSDDVGVTSYQIFKAGVLLATSNTNNFDVTGLTPLTSYTFTLKALDAAGNVSAESSPGMFSTIADTVKPGTASNLQLINITTSSQRLTWNTATDDVGVTSYDVYRNGQMVGNVASIYFDNTGLSAGTTYTYKVVAIDAAGNRSDDSASVFASTLPNQTSAPARKLGDVNNDGKVNVFDLSLLLSKFKSNYTPADFNGDGKVDIFDLSSLLSNYGR